MKSAVALWLTLSVGSVVLAAVTWVQLSRNLGAARQAVAIQLAVERTLRLIVDCESGQRGYSLTGEEKFLEPFRLGETNLNREFSRLVELTQHDSRLLNYVIELRTEIGVVIERLHRIVETRRTNGWEAAAAIVADGKGKQMMDKIRLLAERLSQSQENLLSDGGSATRAQLRRASLTSLIAGLLGVGAGVGAAWLFGLTLKHQVRERALIEAKLEAERSSQEKTVFLANMSHEIRTPMNTILGFTELLEGDLIEPKHRQYMRSIRTSASSLLQLINDILDMSKIEAGVMELRLEPTDPREICEFLHTVFSEPAAKKGVKLECKLAEDLPRALLLDRIRLRQVLVNLLGNAVKFTDHGNICVRVQWQKQESSSHITLLIEVQDTGVGIPKDKLESIFKPFVQAGAHRDKEKAGTGLGLSIVRRLTEKMGGTVTAASVPGQGSAFSLRFPDVPVSVRLAAGEKLDPGGPADFNELRPATLLVVDDHEANCELIAGMFAGSHHRLVFGANGHEALEKAKALRPDAILLDLRMPGMDGREALAEIRKISGLELIPVLAVTASTLESEEIALKTHFSGFVRKPFSSRQLFDELAQFLPPQAEEGPAKGPPTSAPDAASLSAAPELLGELSRLRADEWPALRDSLAINESKAFAAKLRHLAVRWPCPPLDRYASALAQHADSYSIVELEKQLSEFPALVEGLQRGAAA